MAKFVLCAFLALVCGVILTAPVPPCPKACTCSSSRVRCDSSSGLKKALLTPDQVAFIGDLDIDVAGSAIKTNPDLRHLQHLKRLSLASGKIHQVVAAYLPISLERLDLSHNHIEQLPADVMLLPALKGLDLFGNPMSCSCSSLVTRDVLLEKGVKLARPVKCASPDDVRGKLWSTVTCKQVVDGENFVFDMQGDAPYEGSGSDDGSVVTENVHEEKQEKWDTSIEDEFMRVTKSSLAASEPLITEKAELEGSGFGADVESTTEKEDAAVTPQVLPSTTSIQEDEDEDEDYNMELFTDYPNVTEHSTMIEDEFHITNISLIKACNFNCSTPSPLADTNETDVSPAPSFLEGIKIVANDLGIIDSPEATSKSSTNHTTTTSTISEIHTSATSGLIEDTLTTSLPDPKQQKNLEVEEVPPTVDTELIGNRTNITDKKQNMDAEEPERSNSFLIFFAVVLLVLICLVIYTYVKKRALHRNRPEASDKTEGNGKAPEEIELVQKNVVQEADKTNGTQEKIPLMNGHEQNEKDEDEAEIPLMDKEEPEPKMEQKNVRTPEAQRVTIKASEIPNSTPKTPILVTRHVNSDGSVTTTPNDDQQV